MSESTAMKHAYGPQLAQRMARSIQNCTSRFSEKDFVAAATNGLEELELKGRIAHLATALHEHLPGKYADHLRLLHQLLPAPSPASKGTYDYGYHLWPWATYIENYGLDHPAISLDALEAITQRFTAEFAIRPFFLADPDRVLARARSWAVNECFHLRRLASEGLRPRLPWGIQLKPLVVDPSPTLPLLRTLRADPEDYVYRSVANHLNDISKDHPELVIAELTAWNKHPTEHLPYITRHALRGLIKGGHSEALALLGYDPPQLKRTRFTLSATTVQLGTPLSVEVTCHSSSSRSQRIQLDLQLDLVRANGKRGIKVFKGKEIELPARGTVTCHQTLTLKPVTTRRYYNGPHVLRVQGNGENLGEATFELTGCPS